MRILRPSIAGFALLVAAQVPAAESSAPLESTKQELRQLEAAQKNKAAPATPDGVKLAMPTLEAAAPENPVIQQWTDRKKAEERVEKQQKRKSENWLVNGMEQLGREAAAADASTAGTDATDARAGVVDTTDPEYLLKLFDEQKKHADTKEAAAKPHATPAPDPFAPFLQGWLGTSPVKGQVMDQFRKGSEAAGAPVVSGRPEDFRAPDASLTTMTGLAPVPGSLSTAPRPNPYLVDLTPLPSAPQEFSAGTPPLATLDRALSTPGAVPTPPPAITPPPDARTPMRGPPPSPADDKKYFPQLNKF